MEAQTFGEITNCIGSKQREVRLEGRERELSLDWKSLRQETEVGKSGSWNLEVSLSLLASAMPMRDRRF